MKSFRTFFIFMIIAFFGGGSLFLGLAEMTDSGYSFKDKDVTLTTGRGTRNVHGNGFVFGDHLYLDITHEIKTVPVDTTWFKAPLLEMRQKPITKIVDDDSSYGYIQYDRRLVKLKKEDRFTWSIPMNGLEFSVR